MKEGVHLSFESINFEMPVRQSIKVCGGQVGYTNLNSRREGRVRDIKFISKQGALRSHRFPRSMQNGRIEAGGGWSTSLMVPSLRLCASRTTATGRSLIPGQGIRFPHAATNSWHASTKKKKKNLHSATKIGHSQISK